tara:strand:- start:23266 stop:23766 length:501 start_codon:yes stop_codon:yes gene_type:complete
VIAPDITADLQDRYWQAAGLMLLHHTNPWELDEALCDWGYGLGPCAAQDLLGLDRVLARLARPHNPILPRMVAEGRMGKSGGVGYYRYPGGGGAVIDPLIEDLIREEAWFANVARSERGDTELTAAMNEAVAQGRAALIAAGADRAAVADAIVDGLHFPRDRLSEI